MTAKKGSTNAVMELPDDNELPVDKRGLAVAVMELVGAIWSVCSRCAFAFRKELRWWWCVWQCFAPLGGVLSPAVAVAVCKACPFGRSMACAVSRVGTATCAAGEVGELAAVESEDVGGRVRRAGKAEASEGLRGTAEVCEGQSVLEFLTSPLRQNMLDMLN